jgi:hypothetical protein
MRRLALLLSLLFLSPALGKVIISSPKNGDFIDRVVLDVSGVTDEGGVVGLSVYDPSSGEEFNHGFISPDDNGFWSSSVDFSDLESNTVYLIASTILDKSSIMLNLRSNVFVDLSSGTSFKRCSVVQVAGDINGSPSLTTIPLTISRPDDSSFTTSMSRSGDSFIGSFELPCDALTGQWSAYISYADSFFNVASDVLLFNVSVTNVSMDLVSDNYVLLGQNEVRINAFYNNGDPFLGLLNASITSPSGESYNAQFSRCGGYFCKDLLFHSPGKWVLDFTANEIGNLGFFNTSIFVSDELFVDIVDSSSLIGEDVSFKVRVSDYEGNVSFNVSGLAGNIDRVVQSGDLFTLFLDIALLEGEYGFSVSAIDESGNSGSDEGVLSVNDFVLESCINGVCTNSSDSLPASDSYNVSGRVFLTNSDPLRSNVEFYVNGKFIGMAVSDSEGQFYFNLPSTSSGSLLIIARYGELSRNNLFNVIGDSLLEGVIIDFPAVITSDGGLVSSLISLSNPGSSSAEVVFDSSGLPSWIEVPESIIVPAGGSVTDYVRVYGGNASVGVHSLSVSGIADGSAFSKDFVVIIEGKGSGNIISGNLSVSSVSFDLNSSSLIFKISNSDAVSHDIVINYSNTSSTFTIPPLSDDEVFIPFTGFYNAVSVSGDETVLFSMGDELSNSSPSLFVVNGDDPLTVLLLLLGYPVIFLFVISFKIIKRGRRSKEPPVIKF